MSGGTHKESDLSASCGKRSPGLLARHSKVAPEQTSTPPSECKATSTKQKQKGKEERLSSSNDVGVVGGSQENAEEELTCTRIDDVEEEEESVMSLADHTSYSLQQEQESGDKVQLIPTQKEKGKKKKKK